MAAVYIIAEAGVNHNGRVELAYQLIDAAKASGADAVKFQTFKTEKILIQTTSKASYQKEQTGASQSQFDMVKSLELSYADFTGLKNYALSVGIDFLSTPDDVDSLDFLIDELDVPLIKVGSGEVTNLPFLQQIASRQKPIILSTGMANLAEVERAVRLIQGISKKSLVLLHCTTNYPCPSEEVNLRAMQTLEQAFKCVVGYSDHTLGCAVPVAAVALGAQFIEKHLTLDTHMSGPDHKASLNPEEFAHMVRQIRVVEQALGNGIKWPNLSEEKIKPFVRRRIVAAEHLSAGQLISLENLEFKRADAGIYVDAIESVIGMSLLEDINKDRPLEWSFLSRTV
jgi:N-acetylneuraminate synthase